MFGSGQPIGVAVGGTQQQRNLIAAFEGMAENLNLFIGIAGEHMQRRIEAQDFLDRAIDCIRPEDHCRPRPH